MSSIPTTGRRRLALAAAAAGTLTLANGPAADAAQSGGALPVRVTASRADCREAPVSVVVPEARMKKLAALPKGASPTACQAEPAGDGRVRLTFVVRDLKKGETRTYHLAAPRPEGTAAASGGGVEARANGANVDLLVGGKLITRYDTTTGPSKPYLYPLNGPNGGAPVTRRWPVEDTVPGETRDHPHHRGLWFTHGDMNGADFWTEGKNHGKTVHTGYDAVRGGPVYAHLRPRADWVTAEGKKIAEDVRDVRLYPVRGGYLLDFDVAVRAVGGPLRWGDTKEGTFAVRVADSMRSDAGKDKKAEGRIENASGQMQDATWGKPSPWVDYVGPVEGRTVGIAILDHPSNPRHPTPWHVRGYGLFAANAFGLHDFDPAKKNDKDAGVLVTPAGEATTFRYRVFVHDGDTRSAAVPAVWSDYATPPDVQVL